jgi:hypothetical protein
MKRNIAAAPGCLNRHNQAPGMVVMARMNGGKVSRAERTPPPLHLHDSVSQIFDVLHQTWRNHPPLSYKILEVFARGIFSQDERALNLKGQSGHRAHFSTTRSGRE